eukprot:TRINITY_DN656_c0_g1_i2.p1 TRINITY_DN656_c0_g1~~TRINITY_DN656_c0_g1_i2.p1  ORF type:complete len:403 (-),score=52.66 TRINITY_DN656_c0_g1_i2:44-1252(-)
MELKDPLEYVLPYLFVAVFAENAYFYMKGQRIKLYDSLSSFASGGLDLSVEWILLLQQNTIGGFIDNLFTTYQIKEMNILMGFSLLFLVDLSYYWAHYSSHNVSFIWALHAPHHSSEEYNLTTAFRQGLFESLSNFFFFLPWCVFFPFKWIVFFRKINLLWQFFVHTECIYKLPYWFENFFNTPSHHRVHHARNKIYCDKNYGGMFIIWDKIFGTYEEETEKPVFGLVHPVQTFEPLQIQMVHFKNIYEQVMTYPTLSLKLKSLISPPGYTYDPITKKDYVMPLPEKIDGSIPKLDTRGNKYSNVFGIYSFLIIFFTFSWVKGNQNQLFLFDVICLQIVIVCVLSNIFLVNENKRYFTYYYSVFLFTLFTLAVCDFLLISKLYLLCLYSSQFLFQMFVLKNF